MGIFERLYSEIAVKADSGYRTKITGEPRIGPGSESKAVFTVANAAQHGKAYGGGKDGVDHFYDAVNIVAKAVKAAPFHFENDAGERFVLHKGPDDPPEVREVPSDLKELFERPNPWMGWREHIHLAVVDLLSVGNWFWMKHAADRDGNKPWALYRMAPPFVQLESEKGKLIARYLYSHESKPIKLEPRQVVHARLPNPLSPNATLGLGVVQAAPQVFDVELGMLSAQRRFFQGGTVLAGALESDKSIPAPNRKQITREFQNMHRGSKNWYNVAFLERGLRYRPIQANAQEAGYATLSKTSRDRIFALLGVPKILAGVDDGTMKLEEGRRFLAEETVQPLLGDIAEVISDALTEAWGLRMVYDYGYQLPESDRIGIALDFSELPGVTVKEVRVKAGLAPLGPDVKDDEGVPIDEYVLNMPGPSTEMPGGSADRRSRQGGRPPDGENVPGFPAESDDAGNRDGTDVDGRPPSAADRSRRRTAGVVRPSRSGKALAGITLNDLVANNAAELIEGALRHG